MDSAVADPSSRATMPLLVPNELHVDNERISHDDGWPAYQRTPQSDTDSATDQVGIVPTWLQRVQQRCQLAAQLMSLASVALVLAWVHKLGGVSLTRWTRQKPSVVFNWHPVLMITAFSFMTVASLVYRGSLLCSSNGSTVISHSTRKWIHGIAWVVALLCGLVGVLAVLHSHNQGPKFIANLYSLHSWVGVSVICLYVTQFTIGVYAFASPSRTFGIHYLRHKTTIMLFHKFVGPVVYVGTAATILLGIQEKEGFVGCAYKVTAADRFPIQHLLDIPSSCLISHSLGVLVGTTALLTTFALQNFDPPMILPHST